MPWPDRPDDGGHPCRVIEHEVLPQLSPRPGSVPAGTAGRVPPRLGDPRRAGPDGRRRAVHPAGEDQATAELLRMPPLEKYQVPSIKGQVPSTKSQVPGSKNQNEQRTKSQVLRDKSQREEQKPKFQVTRSKCQGRKPQGETRNSKFQRECENPSSK